jgi:hypothetical protein
VEQVARRNCLLLICRVPRIMKLQIGSNLTRPTATYQRGQHPRQLHLAAGRPRLALLLVLVRVRTWSINMGQLSWIG